MKLISSMSSKNLYPAEVIFLVEVRAILMDHM
uniref:Uncharacterized protein n=1 Tax=Rhizophora mucronata TaxID=61149 RepID=A0A2P2IJ97_RHIMU